MKHMQENEHETATIRPLQRDDHPALIDLVRRTWYADFSERIGMLAAEADWENCLARTTNAYTAVVNGKPVALILGRIDSRETRNRCNAHALRYLRLLGGLMRSREGLRAAHEIVGILALDRMLRSRASRSGHDYAAEVVLFALSPEAQGHGLGKRMFRRMIDDFRMNGMTKYFLFTDTSCNVGFYTHHGLERIASIDLDASRYHHDDMSFYLYEGVVPEHD